MPRGSPLGVPAEDSFLDSDAEQACALTTGFNERGDLSTVTEEATPQGVTFIGIP